MNIRKYSFTIIILVGILSILFIAGKYQDDPKSELAKAEQLYKSAKFDDAIEILKQLSSEENKDIEIRKNALRFLGRAYTAKKLYNEAKESLLTLLKLEPPIIEFNPDYESPTFMKLYYESRKEFSNGSTLLERPDPGMKTLAIIDFKNRSINNKTQFDPMEQGFADLMINRLNNSTGLKVVERERIKWILDEINLQGEVGMEGAVRLGKQLGVQTVFLGSFIVYKDDLWLGGRLVKVESSEILLTDEIKGDVDDFFDLIDKLGKKISEKINIQLKDLTEEQVSHAPNLEAIMAYSVGLSFLEREDYKNAYEKFQEALKYDPYYEKAQNKAQSIAPYLAGR